MSWILAAVDSHSPSDRLRIVTGNAGVGKSRLVAEAALVAASRGWRVIWGRSWNAEITPPYWPWTQVARDILDVKGVDLGEVLLGDTAPVERFEIFDAMTELVRDTARATPVMIVLEDLHESDSASLLLMRFLAAQLADSRVVVVGTFRREGSDQQLAALLDLDGADSRGVTRELAPLGLSEVRQVLDDSPLAPDVYAVTGGNPLLIEQLAKSDGVEDLRDGQLESLSKLTAERILQLPESTQRVLTAIALLGSRPTLARVAAVLETPASDLESELRPALDADVIVPDGQRSADESGRVRFRHQLFAETALRIENHDVLRELHGRAATLCATEHGREAQRAHHLLLAGPDHLDEAVAACRDASRIAAGMGAHEDAIAHLSRALAAGDAATAWNPADRVRIVLELGRLHSAAGDHAAATNAFDEAWAIAQQHGDHEAMGYAALGPCVRFDFTGPGPVHRAELCAEALHALPESPSALRVKLLATLAISQLGERDPIVSQRTADDALEMAAKAGDPLALGYALLATIVTDLGPASLDHRLSAARKVLAIARDAGDRDLAANGHFLLLGALMEQGNIRGLDRELESRNRLTARYADMVDGRHAGWLRCMRALLDGQADKAERLAEESFAIAERESDPDRMIVWAAQIAIVRWLQGRVTEIEPIFLEARRIQPDVPAWSATLAWLWARTERLDAARGAVDVIAALHDIPRDRNWLVVMATLAEVAIALGDEHLAERIREELLPYAERMVPIGLGVACWGTVARPLALLAIFQNRQREAISHYRTAIKTASQCGAYPWLAESQLELAEYLAQHDGNPHEVRRLVAEAEAMIRQLDLPVLSARFRAITTGNSDAANARPAHAAPAAQSGKPRVNVLGTFEVLDDRGEIAAWNSRKARELLKILVARFGQPVARDQLMDLLWPEEQGTLANRLSVATTAVRRALDPRREQAPDFYLRSDGDVLKLHGEHISVDVWEFLTGARTILASEDPSAPHLLLAARDLIDAYRGDALVDEPYSDWATGIRSEAQAAFCDLSRVQADAAAADGDHVLASQACQRILRVDPYNSLAHESLVAALSALGAHGQARAARLSHEARMAEIDG